MSSTEQTPVETEVTTVETTEPLAVDPSLAFTTSERSPDEERIPLFAIDDVTYTVPARPRPTLALRYLRDLRTVGETVAVSALLTTLLGDEGFNALIEYEDLTMEDFEAVVTKAQELVLGGQAAAAKN